MIQNAGQVLHHLIDRRASSSAAQHPDPVTVEWWTPLQAVGVFVSAESLALADEHQLLDEIVWRTPVDLVFSPLLRARLELLLAPTQSSGSDD